MNIDKENKDTVIDNVNMPSHYISKRGIECIDVIESFGLNFNKGNSIKYILRAGKKGGGKEKNIEDLQKSIWYLKREIKFLSSN